MIHLKILKSCTSGSAHITRFFKTYFNDLSPLGGTEVITRLSKKITKPNNRFATILKSSRDVRNKDIVDIMNDYIFHGYNVVIEFEGDNSGEPSHPCVYRIYRRDDGAVRHLCNDIVVPYSPNIKPKAADTWWSNDASELIRESKPKYPKHDIRYNNKYHPR